MSSWQSHKKMSRGLRSFQRATWNRLQDSKINWKSGGSKLSPIREARLNGPRTLWSEIPVRHRIQILSSLRGWTSRKSAMLSTYSNWNCRKNNWQPITRKILFSTQSRRSLQSQPCKRNLSSLVLKRQRLFWWPGTLLSLKQAGR